MKILLLTYGTRGDVQPYVALGRALTHRGHTVRLVTSSRFEGFVRQHGMDFAGLSDEMLGVLDSDEGKSIIESTRSIWDSVRHYWRFAGRLGPMLRGQLSDAWSAANSFEPDLVVFHPKGFAGPLIAEHFGVHAVLALPFPMLVPTGERPHLGFPALPLGRFYNRWTYGLVNALAGRAMKKPLRSFRATHDLPRAKRYDPLHGADGTRLPTLTAVSPSVVPEPRDWGSRDRMCGYWFLDDDTPPTDELESFLDAGPPPVYIGFGSMAGRDPARLTHVAIEALERTGQRGILATGWGGLESSSSRDAILSIDSAPHRWLFPRTSVIVHHGGAGTTAEALRSGNPTLVVPFMGDQPFWGDRIEALGVGPQKIRQGKLTVDRLARAIESALNDKSMRRRAQVLGERIRSEDGLARAVSTLEALA